MSAADSVVSIRGLSKVFGKGGVTALEGIELEVERGEFVSLIGPSGCGKSTLLRIVGDIVEPTEGVVTVNGKPARKARLDRDYGIVFQAPVLYDWRTVAKNIALPLEMLGWDAPKRAARIKEMVELVELSGFEKHHPWQLSGGMQQRVSIARAFSFSTGAPAHGRAVRRARRDDPRAAQPRAAAHLGGDRLDGDLRDPLHLRGGVPVHASRRHVAAAGPDRVGRPDRPAATADDETREEPRFFELVTQVRESLHATGADEVEETLATEDEIA